MIIIVLLALALLAVLRFWGAGAIMATIGHPYGELTLHAIGVALIVALALFVDQVIRIFYWDLYLHRRRQRPTPALIRDLLTIAIIILGLSIGLSVEEGFTFTGLITASGATAVVLGIALQAAIQDAFSGLSIQVDHSYALGDWLTVFSEQTHEPQYGRVTGITWRTTFLELQDGTRLMIPNHIMTANLVLNHSKPYEPKRLSVEVMLDNRVESDRVIDLLSGETFKTVRTAPGLSRQPDPYVILQKVTSDAAVYEIRFYFWPDQINPSRAQSSVLIAALDILQKNDIPMSVSQVELTQKPDLAFILGEEEKQGALSRAPLFAHALDTEHLMQLSRSCAVVEFPRGAVLMKQGDPPTCMYCILEGAVSVSIAGGNGGASHEVAVSAAGDIVGEIAFMIGANRTATVTALARVRALEIGKADIESLLRAHPGLAERFAQTLARRTQELDEAAHRAARKESQATDILARMMSFFSRAFT